MENKAFIYSKLEHFIKKYYTNELIKGVLLFIAIGLFYFICTFLIEYFFWFSSSGRSFLFWSFVLFECLLLFNFILIPLFKLFKLQKGINYEDASAIIGNHFNEIKDKLLNFLQLANSTETNELVLASIDQKANKLKPIPFGNAINFSKNKKFLPYTLVALLIFISFFITGNSEIVSSSFSRVVQYNNQFKKPAPFEFFFINKNFIVEENSNFTLIVSTKGKVIPENIEIHFNGENYFLKKKSNNLFTYTFTNLNQNINFHLSSSDYNSDTKTISIINKPTISVFKLFLDYPNYLGKKDEYILGTGNASIPSGTKVSWGLSAINTSEIFFNESSNKLKFAKNEAGFNFSKIIKSNLDYRLVLNNSNYKNIHQLAYHIQVIQDQYPTIEVKQIPDSLKLKQDYCLGNVSDDYGLTKLNVVYYDAKNPKESNRFRLNLKNTKFDQFVYSFPQGITLQAGVNYSYYFEVVDNDAANGFKKSKSAVFNYYELTTEQKENRALQEQKEAFKSLSSTLNNQNSSLKEFDKLKQIEKEKSTIDYKDQKKISNFLERQKEQQQMLQDFSNKIRESLSDLKTQHSDKDKEELLQKLEKTEKEAKKNEALLKELQKFQDKLSKEELFEKIDQLKKESKSQTRSLEQLLELTKKLYVEEKAKQLVNQLDQLANKQEKLSNNSQNNKDKQNELNDEFNKLSEDLKELQKDNQSLKDPLDLPNDKGAEEDIKEDQKQASESLQKNNKSSASKKQKSAAGKMKQMAQKMSSEMDMSEMEQNNEDAAALRKILENLIHLSFNQEKAMINFKKLGNATTGLNVLLKEQQNIKNQFKHIDDSIFAVSLRQPKIAEFVYKSIEDINYNTDKAIELLPSQNRSKGISHQQFTLSSINQLADFLSNIQSSMSMSMSGSGGKGKPKPGQGSGQQLSDIIQKQKGLGQQMQDGIQSKPGSKGKEGESGKEGNKGDKQGQGTNGSQGAEGDAGKLLEVIKQQQELREALQEQLDKEGLGGNGQTALKQMKELEKQLINKGFTQENLNRVLQLNYELLKLEAAQKMQGEDNKRESNTNRSNFNGSANQLPPTLLNYIRSVEILNRQSLPLQPNYNQKVQNYFK